MNIIERVRTHYPATGLLERIRLALAEIAPENTMLGPEQLAGFNQLQTLALVRDA